MRSNCKPLPPAFFLPLPTVVAPALIGKLLIRRLGGHERRARIVETEAYLGTSDAAAHASHGLTRRTAILFGPPGRAYIYLSYGIHLCLNVSTCAEGEAGGVLFRAAFEWRGPLRGSAARPAFARAGLGTPEPQTGTNEWRGPLRGSAARPAFTRAGLGTPEPQTGAAPSFAAAGDYRALSGPGKLTRGLAITADLNGCDLTRPGPLFLATDLAIDPAEDNAARGSIVITTRVGISKAAEQPYRYYLEGHPAVSGRRTPVLGRIAAIP
ncbi:MAG TPA: DNA-3-methyladenine glycosylase [Terriglobales bacterium]